MSKKLQILITGPVPPPAGGISIHIQRLKYLVEDVFSVDLIDESGTSKPGIFNMRSLNIVSYLKKVKHSDLLFIHSGNKLFKKIHIVAGRLFGKKVIITLHGYGVRRSQPFRSIDKLFFSLAHKIILVNADIANRVSLQSDKVVVQHAFLPPVMDAEPSLPVRITGWLHEASAKRQVIICANASRLDMHNNQDLYGLDMCIEVMSRLRRKGLPVAFVFIVSSLENGDEVYNKNMATIKALGLDPHFLLLNERLSFVKLIEQCDIVLRPSNADGDALTVREGLYLGKSVLASNVVERPGGTALFNTRDMGDLEIQLEKMVRSVDASQHRITTYKSNQREDFKSFYVDLINSVALK